MTAGTSPEFGEAMMGFHMRLWLFGINPGSFTTDVYLQTVGRIRFLDNIRRQKHDDRRQNEELSRFARVCALRYEESRLDCVWQGAAGGR
jgi:hypothetical protein